LPWNVMVFWNSWKKTLKQKHFVNVKPSSCWPPLTGFERQLPPVEGTAVDFSATAMTILKMMRSCPTQLFLLLLHQKLKYVTLMRRWLVVVV